MKIVLHRLDKKKLLMGVDADCIASKMLINCLSQKKMFVY